MFVVLKKAVFVLSQTKHSTPTNQGRGGETGSVRGGVRGKRGELERTLMMLIGIPELLDVLLGSITLNKIYKRSLPLSDYA